MNETLQNIMLFINEHTLLLIGICVFLILVLVGYLIDNSVKSKRIRKDIKNADQVPENIKDEIIKQAESKTINKEEVKTEEKPTDLVIENNEALTEELNAPASLENPVQTNNMDTNVQLDNANNDNQINIETQNTTDINSSLDLDSSNIQTSQEDLSSSFNLDLEPQTSVNVESPIDPDAFIMGSVSKNEYSNDKKLSDILSNINNYNQSEDVVSISDLPSEQPTVDTDIFSDSISNIVVNENVSKNDVQIQNENEQVENNNSTDELDRIMRKLSSMDNDVKEDNYTNIF